MIVRKTSRQPTAADHEISRRIRVLRSERGFSRQLLADRLGISIQQLQKYEYCVDRISASRLKNIADVFKVSIDYFFEKGKTAASHRPKKSSLIDADYVSHLIMLFSEIKNVRQRQAVIRLLKEIADN